MAAAHLAGPYVEPVSIAYRYGCTEKVRHSRFDAWEITARRGRGSYYACLSCGTWHTALAPLRNSLLQPKKD